MKFTFLILLTCFSTQILGKTVQDFNKALIEDVQKDIKQDNDYDLKTKESITRSPASVESVEESRSEEIEEESKIDKSFRQIGSKNW
jgi:putative lipoic acid-binding regulatory protein